MPRLLCAFAGIEESSYSIETVVESLQIGPRTRDNSRINGFQFRYFSRNRLRIFSALEFAYKLQQERVFVKIRLGPARRYRFRCNEGQQWALKGGRLTIGDARQVAHERGGSCLSEHYVNARSKLTWQCHRGHVRQANLDSVRNKRK